MRLPKQAAPVTRPHFVEPADCINVTDGTPDQLLRIRMELLEGANYNDPAPFRYPSYGYLATSEFSGFPQRRVRRWF